MENTSAEAAVTKVVDRIPREGMDAQLEESMKNLIAAAQGLALSQAEPVNA